MCKPRKKLLGGWNQTKGAAAPTVLVFMAGDPALTGWANVGRAYGALHGK